MGYYKSADEIEFEEVWDFIVENGIASEETCTVVCNISGQRTENLNDIIYVQTGYHDMEQAIESGKYIA